MWSLSVFFLLAGLAFASNNPGWTESQEYIYKVRGRTLTGIVESSDQYVGFLFRTTLRIQPKSDGQMQALLTNPEYSQVHSILSNGYKTKLPEEELSWKPLIMSQKPFQWQIKNGKIVNLIVSKDVKTWEANMIKGIVSVFQLNVNGENALPSTLNVLPDQNSNNAVFLTMEDTVSGETETLYEIRPVSDYLTDFSRHSKHFNENGEVIEIIKHKNYENQQELPSYTSGFGDYLTGAKQATNQMGSFFSRDTTGRAFLVGNLRHYTILNSSMVSSFLINPTITDQQKTAVFSVIEADLLDIKSQDEIIENISEPVELGNLVYSYNHPKSEGNKKSHRSGQEQDNDEFNDGRYSRVYDRLRKPRSLNKRSSDQFSNDEYYYTEDQPKITQGSENPLVNYTNSFEGKSRRNSLTTDVEKLAKKIGNDLFDSNKDHHEKTLERFAKLISIIRYMNAEECMQVSHKLYSQAEEGSEKATWPVFRDAVAESGSGPAFLTIESWIDSAKISGEEAAQVVSTMSKAATQPTLQYMKSFFKLTKKEKVLREWPLNDTALISFAHLARTAYVDKKLARTEYPVNAFGPFRTEETKQFITKEVIPYYTEMLKHAVQRAETHKIHTYIQVLGHIADPRILAAYEPYLEGKEQASQFQRLLMVLSLEKLAEVEPDVTRAILFRIYQNPSESCALRIAAVFHIMRSRPTTEMLQSMAQYTNIDQNEYVNAAVKQSIEQLSELDDEEFFLLRKEAEAARAFLTRKNYGANYASTYLRGYFINELNEHIKSTSQMFTSEDDYYPKGFRYTSRSSWAGLHRKEINIQAFVSSIDQLADVAYKQTKTFKNKQNQQKEQSQEQGQHPWSSQNIAKILDMKADEREQLEGFLSSEFGNPFRMFSFDNNTMAQMPQFIKQWESDFRNGQKINYYKLAQLKEMTLAIPTVMGVPCIFKYATPMLVKAQGEIRMAANPQFSQSSYLQQPQEVKIESEMRITVSGKTQGRVFFIAPFEGQKYISGYDKHWELNLPRIMTKINFDSKQQEFQMEMKSNQESKINILHYHTWPYTARVDTLSLEPLSSQANQKVVKPKNMQSYRTILGEKSTGVAFEVKLNHERKNVHLDLLRRIFTKNGFFNGLRELYEDGNIQNSEFDITYLPEQSSASKIVLRSKYDEEYRERPEAKQGKFVLNEDAEPTQRQKDLMRDVSAEIENVKVMAMDTTIQFQGKRNIQYLFTAAAAKSNVDPKSKSRICFKRSSKDDKTEDYDAHFILQNKAENTNGLDLDNSLENEPKMDSEIEVVYGYSDKKPSKLKAKLQHTRSEERKRYLKNLPLYHQCKQEMGRGNKALETCTQMIMISNLLDRAQVKIQYQDLTPDFEDSIQMIFDAARTYALPSLEIRKHQKVEENEIRVNIKFHDDLKYLNATVQTQNEETCVENMPIDKLTRQVVVPHPVFHVRARVLSQLYGTESYREFCTVDRTKVKTFTNKTYDAEISKYWTVMALYAPKEAREEGQNQQQNSLQNKFKTQLENFVVLVRESQESQDKKDVKVVFSSPETNYQMAEIEMKPMQISINSKQVQVSEKRSHDAYEGYVQIYALPNGEVKVEIDNAFYLIYDGERVRLTAVNGKFKDATRGLCGQFNGHTTEDFLTSENCIAREPQKFVKSFEIEGEQGKQIRSQFAANDKQCVTKQEPLYVNIITGMDTRRGDSEEEHHQGRQCLFHQTRYVQQNGEICFTTIPLPTCKSNCEADSHKNKQVGVHCVKKSNVVELWKNQIDNGGSPDFSNKKQHTTIQMTVPGSCSM